MTREGMSLVTTEPAAMREPLPMVTPGQTTVFPPIHTLSPMVMGRPNSRPVSRTSGVVGCPAV